MLRGVLGPSPCKSGGRERPEATKRRGRTIFDWLGDRASTGAERFNEFLQAVGRIPPATLATRLSELERAGLVERVVVDARPPRAEYRLTPRGKKLRPVVEALVTLMR